MPNSLVDAYRKDLASRGQSDPRPDDFITAELGAAAQQSNPELFDQYPDFAKEWQAVRESNAPSLTGEAGRAIKSGAQELAATGAGIGALVTGSDYLKEKARSFQEDAAQNAPTIPSIGDIGGVKDAIRYGVAKVAGAAPSLAEGVGLAAAGAAAGSALGPEGTAAGAIEGGLEGFLGRGVVKSAIKRLLATQGDAMVASKLIPEATETAVADAIRSGAPDLLKAIETESSAILARRAGTAANALNMYGLNAGALYNETGNPEVAAIGGAAGAVPAVVLPEIVIQKLYPGVAKEVGKRLGSQYVTRLATEALKDAGVLGSAMSLQEASNLVAKNIADGKDPVDFTGADWKRIAEAGIGGALTGPLLSPLTARENADVFDPGAAKARAEAARTAAAQAAVAAPVSEPVPAPAVETASPAKRVALMTADQKTARATELSGRLGDLTPDEQQELSLLQAFVGSTEPTAGAAEPVAAPAAEAPAETPAPGMEPVVESPPSPETPQEFRLPKDLAGAKPRYSYGDKRFTLQFESELDKAAYILAQKTRSARDEDYLAAVVGQTGMTEDEARAHGALVRDQIKALAREGEGGTQLDIPTVERATATEPVPTAPAEPVAAPAPEPVPEPAPAETTPPISPDPLGAPPLNSAETGTPPEAGDSAVPATIEPQPAPVPEQVSLEAAAPNIPESPSLEQRLRDEIANPPAFTFGKVDENAGTIDLHDDPRFENLTGEEVNRLPVQNWSDDSGNRSRTRVAVVLEAPDGHYVKAGILPAQEIASIGSAGERATGPVVQSMASETRRGGNYQKVLNEGGIRPALLADLVDAGYKLRAIVHFDEKPGSIFQRFDSRAAYDASYAATDKSAGTSAARTIPTLSQSEGITRAKVVSERTAIENQIDSLSKQLSTADPATAADLNEQVSQLYDRLRQLPEPRLMTEARRQPPAAIESDRTQQFTAAVAAARQAGLKVDVLMAGVLKANLEAELSARADRLANRYFDSKEEEQPALQAQIERLQSQINALDRIKGVTYTPWHIALGLQDVRNQNISGMVALLHEIGHTIVGRADPEMQGRVIRAVSGIMDHMLEERSRKEAQTGVREANLGDPEELLVSTIAQRLAVEGVPDSPSLARALVQWVKDLYYRLAMGIQAAFGREPDPQLALDWFENQLRRTVGGDYDYRFASLFDRFQPEVPSQEVVRHTPDGGTPGNVSDFYDRQTDKVRQPQVLPDTRESIAWDLKFMAEDPDLGKELEIPAREANARILGAAVNELAAFAEKSYADLVPAVEGEPRMTFDQFWTLAGYGDTPKLRLADLEAQFKDSGTAQIGGDRMTEPMNQQARVLAKRLLYKARNTIAARAATKAETSARAEGQLVAQAKVLNKIEGDLRNAEMHESTLRDSLKEMIRGMVAGARRGLDTAFAAGGLARAIRDAEGLSERDAIPKEYQRVFKAVLADEVPVFQYVDAIAKLDLPLKDMTQAEILSAIEDNAAGDDALAKLVDPANKPLLVALAALSKKEAAQMDLIQMRAVKDPQEYLALKSQLDEIKRATPAQFKELEKQISQGRKAATLADRIKQNAIKARSKLRRYQDTIKDADEAQAVLGKVKGALDQKITDFEVGSLPAPSEWRPYAGEKYLAMAQDKDGRWRSAERTLEWTPEGPAANAEQMLSDLAGNLQYLEDQKSKRGSKTYQLVEAMTNELGMLDTMRKTPEIKRLWFEKFLLPSSKLLVSGGGAGAARAEQMLNRFQFIVFRDWHSEIENPAIDWNNKANRAAKEAGMKDVKSFLNQAYEPALYLIESEPGLQEGPALREAVRAAKARLTTEVTPEFDAAFKDLLRSTKAMSERFLGIAQDHGLFVQDDKLGELRHAISRGWLTVMRSMNTATVSTILRDMENLGWRMVFKDASGGKVEKRLDQGVAAGERVVGAASFDKLLPENAETDPDREARIKVLESPDAFAKAISGFFTPGIIQRWLEPFINKPGASVFKHAGEDIDPLDVQAAWQTAAGDVAKWIDALGERVGLEKLVDLDEEVSLGDTSIEAQWRVEMLKQLDSLFLMESRVAADANQTRGLFDATGRPPHLIMDARENDLLPPEHITHAAFDLQSSRNLLATLAFHGAFGRNGEAMNRAVAEIQSNLHARKSAFDEVMSKNTTKANREAAALALGYDFKELRRAASIYKTVEQGLGALKAQFGFNSSATMLNDVRGGLEFLHFLAMQVTNNPKTGLLNLLQPAQRALARRSIGAATLRDTVGAYGQIGKQFFGQALESFGLHLLRASEYSADIGSSQGQAFGQLPWSEVAGVAAGRRGEQLPLPVRAMRTITGLQRKGVRPGFGEAREFPRMQAIPVLSNVMQGIGVAAAISNGTAEARAIEGVVNATMQHFAVHPEHVADPTYRITHEDIAPYARALAMDRTSFDYLRRKMVEYNIGPLERVARDAMDRQTRGEPILTKDQTLKAAQLAGNEIDLQSSINTTPASWDTNPVLKFVTPLLGWPIRQMNQVHEAMRTAEGRITALQAMKTLGILATWSLPVGLAFTFLTDQYDEKILRKKTQLGAVEPTALIPGVGVPLALATGAQPAKQQLISMFQRLSRAGNIYGLGFDFASTVLAGTDPTSGQRPFSMDGRILAFSQLMNFQQALSNWYNSGFATTYANVERPLIQALVGSGPLQAIDILGNVLGIDNQEMRIAQRTNASQWLRAAGREAGFELRRGGGGSVAPTPMSVWTREMYLAALAGDRLDFQDSYRRAIDAARDDGDKDPQAKVLESWRSRDPLEVFRTKPTEVQLAQIIGTMSDSGRDAVQTALRMFKQYTDMIALTPADRYEHRMLSQISRVPNINSMRASLAGGSYSFR